MLKLSTKIKKLLLALIIGGYVLLLFAFSQIPDRKFHIYFLDIGQGDSILIKTPENHQILIDGGPKNFVMEELSEVLPFFDKSIDLVILTHPHADHLDGLVEVLERYEVKNILLGGVDFVNSTYDEFLREINEKDIRVFAAEADTDFLFGDVVLDVIYPIKQVVGKSFNNMNNSSVAVKVKYDGKNILLTGDIEKEVEIELIAVNAELKADILKAGHHGSKSSSSLEFLNKIKPEIVVIQVGEGNSFGHPHKETLENFEKAGVKKIYRNDRDGRIEFVF